MQIVNADGTVTRSGQLLLEQFQAPSVTEGTHAQRPDPASVADGTLYVESDRGVVYYNNQGFWVYLAGTMWDTVNPDHRPTDLTPQDANFDYRGTDQARQFFWTGSTWVEATLVRYGTHAQRLALTLANVTDSELFVEWDRKYVTYQNQGGVWHYIAGTMFGTLSPDQRPTDLGTNDAGFDFRGTDQQREFIWSGTAWVEVTPVTGSLNLTHPDVVTKVGSTPGQIVEGGITDHSAANSSSMLISAAGNVGIATGTNTPNPLTVGGTGYTGQIRMTSAAYGVVFLVDPSAADFYFLTTNSGDPFGSYTSLRPIIVNLSNGFVGLGGPPNHMLEVTTDSAAKPSTSTWTVSSDLRLKKDIKPFTDGLAVIEKLEPIRFAYNGDGGMPEGLEGIGFGAQQVKPHMPYAVGSHKGKLKATDAQETDILDYNNHALTMVLVNAVQELAKRLSALEIR
jgi:hypothetical protein